MRSEITYLFFGGLSYVVFLSSAWKKSKIKEHVQIVFVLRNSVEPFVFGSCFRTLSVIFVSDSSFNKSELLGMVVFPTL